MLYRIGCETSIHVCDNRKKLIRKYHKMPIAIYEHDGNMALDTGDKLLTVKYCPLCGATPSTEKYEPEWGRKYHNISELYDPNLDI